MIANGAGPAPHAALADELLAASRAIAAMAAGRSLPAALADATATLRPATGGAWPDASRAAIQHIAYDTARRLGAARFVLTQLAPRAPAAATAALAHVAFAQLLEARRPDAVLVDQAIVAARRDAAIAPAAGFLNAVLRRFARERAHWLAAIERDEPAHWNHPQWWIDALRRDHPDQWRPVLQLAGRAPPMTLRVNRRQVSRERALQRLVDEKVAAEPVGDDGIVLESPRDVTRVPGFAEGWLSVQDWGAQLAAPLLAASDGQRVLDACAAPGGKTAHLLERADAELVAVDVDGARLARVADNLRRLRLAEPSEDETSGPAASEPAGLVSATGRPIRLLATDAAAADTWWDGRPFDRILLDAPCSASGIVRRHPDVRWLRRRGDAATLSQAQARLLDALWPLLAPGGKLLYATCSLFRAENAAAVDRFVSRHADCRPAGDAIELLPSDAPGRRHDGFFYALLDKTN